MNLDPIKKRIEAQDEYLTCTHRGGLCHTHNTPPSGIEARNELIQLTAEVERLQGARIRLINSRKTLTTASSKTKKEQSGRNSADDGTQT